MESYQAKAYLPSRLPTSQNLGWSVRMFDWSGSVLRRTFILQEGPEGHLLVLFGTYESLARTIRAFSSARVLRRKAAVVRTHDWKISAGARELCDWLGGDGSKSRAGLMRSV